MSYNPSMENKSLIKLPGLVDLHVHLRDPGQTHKEDFYTGTSAALAGGYTAVFDMPNNATPVTSFEALEAKISSAKKQIVCDVGLYFGSLGDNLNEFDKIRDKVSGLKLYLNMTTGQYLLDHSKLADTYAAWDCPKPILVHAEDEGGMLGAVIEVVKQTKQPTHICHLSQASELKQIIAAKDQGLPITCGATPHHLFLTDQDAVRLGAFGHMKPILKPQTDVDFLWQNLDAIDVVESDHAPHQRAEKESDVPPFGVPGLETTLPLLLQAEREGRISRNDIIAKCHSTPLRILGLAEEPATYIEVSLEEYEIKDADLKTKCGWSPFVEGIVYGRIENVYLRGQEVYAKGQIAAQPGSGRVLP